MLHQDILGGRLPQIISLLLLHCVHNSRHTILMHSKLMDFSVSILNKCTSVNYFLLRILLYDQVYSLSTLILVMIDNTRIQTMFDSSFSSVVCRRPHVLFTLFVFVCV